MRISIVIPAYREAGRVAETVRAVRLALAGQEHEIVVVDDGSPDNTAAEAEGAGARLIRLPRNRGKGEALRTGLADAGGEILVMADADLGATAGEVTRLIGPILAGEADVTVATFLAVPGHKGGFGLVMRLARWGVRRAGGPEMRAPLSGQRALTRTAWEKIGRLDPGFGAEMGLNLDALRLGLRIVEVPTAMTHRMTGRDWAGFRHRGRQFRDVALAVLRRWPLGSAHHGGTETRRGS
jgi:glycosyltransferase involved in cell wall biosynthesis